MKLLGTSPATKPGTNAGVEMAGTTWGAMLRDFVAPAVLGKTAGGVVLVALLNYGQVASERNG